MREAFENRAFTAGGQGTSLVAQSVKSLLAAQEAWFLSLATHSSILAWRIPWSEEPGEL